MSLNVQNFTPAFVLHTRPYRETSLLVEFFTHDFGRISAVARGAKRKHSRLAGILMPFVPLGITFKGKTDLVTLYNAEYSAEPKAAPHCLQGSALFCGLYINELLLRLLPKQDAHMALYTHYQSILRELVLPPTTPNDPWHQRRALGLFEKHLLQEIGYGLELSKTVAGAAIAKGAHYTFEAGTGIIETIGQQHEVQQMQKTGQVVRQQHACQPIVKIKGENLLALQAGNLTTVADLTAAERVLAQVLYFLLGDKYWQCRRLLGSVFDC